MKIFIKIISSMLVLVCLHFTDWAQVSDPVPDPILPSGIILEFQEFVTIPPSSPSKPYARINLLRDAPDGSGRLFVNDLRGEFWVIVNDMPQLFVNLEEVFPSFIDEPGFGTGFGAFAFHPEFAENGLFYTSHAESAGSGPADFTPIESNGISMQWVITEWQINDPSSNTFSGNRKELFRVDFPSHLHGIQEISFNPTAHQGDEDYGLLYICVGDAGSSLNYMGGNLQTTESVFGTILRIDPSGSSSANSQYGIPSTNPFFNDADSLTIKEIYAYGFRNPHRISWDASGDHKMLLGDIGEKNIEEVNLILPGHNYGWENREGTFFYDRSLGREFVWELPGDDSTYNFTYPVAQFDHDEGAAIIGGYVYRGNTLPMLEGQYIFGDIPSGKIFHAAADEFQLGQQTPIYRIAFVDENYSGTNLLDLVDHDRTDLRFGVDSENEIYFLTKADGKIRKIVDPNATSTLERIQNMVSWLSPNPGMGVFQLKMEEEQSAPFNLKIVSAIGQEVWHQEFNIAPNSVDLSNLTSGLYYAKWQLENGQVFLQSFVKR